MKPKLIPILFAAFCTANLASAQTTLSINEAGTPAVTIVEATGTAAFTRSFHDHVSVGKSTRGNSFLMPDTGDANTGYSITGLTLQKSATQAFSAGDTLELWVFSFDSANWENGDGIDPNQVGGDNDPLDGTGSTLLHAQTFDLNGLSFTDQQYFTFNFSSSPLFMDENTEYGFLIGYVDGGPGPDYFEYEQHNTSSYAGGTLIRTQGKPSANEGDQPQDLTFYLTGTATGAGGTTLSINEPSAPTGAIVSSTGSANYTRAFHSHGTAGKTTRGSTLLMPDTGDAGTDYSVTGLTLQKSASQAFESGDTLELWIFAYAPSNDGNDTTSWVLGDGMDPTNGGDNDPLDDTGATLLLAETFDLNGLSFTADQYFSFDFSGSPLTMSENTAYGFLIGYTDGGGTGTDYFEYKQANVGSYGDGQQIRTQGIPTANTADSVIDTTFYLTGSAISGGGSLELASPFQDGMILQRGKPIPVWGWADAETEVSVTLDGTMLSTNAGADGRWSLEMPTMTAGGPYTMTVASGAEAIELNDVLIGDVWITFGQSNMVRPLSEMDGAAAYIRDITNNNLPIRCLRIEQMAATSPADTGNMIWEDGSDDPGSWTSVGTVFAYQMHQATGVPTAILWAAWGSSYIEGWMPIEMTADFPHFATRMETYYASEEAQVESILNTITKPWPQPWPIPPSTDEVFLRTRPNIIYNQMIHPLIPYGISGFVWYQGEANANNAVDSAQYGFTLPGFAAEYCKRFGQENLQFLGVQLPSYNSTYWPWFRESQNRLGNLANGHVAVTIDTGNPSNIHPTDKAPIGIRLSLLARKYALGESIESHGPLCDSFSVNGNQVTVSFTHADVLSTDDALAPATFELAGADQVFYAATSASISGTDVILSSASVPNPVAVRYAWSPAPVASVNLVNSAGLPAAPFRTDNWPMPGLSAQAPQSVNDSYATPYQQPLVVPVDGVLANDMDLNHDPLTVSLVSEVSNGTLILSSNGSFTYTPHPGFSGTDSFTYRCSDGTLNSPDATVTLSVGPSGYDQWKAGIAWNLGDDDSKTGDPEGDGVENFLEYALGMDPLVADHSGLPTLTPNGTDAEYDFNNFRDGVDYEVLLSFDLVTWSDPPFAVLTSADSTPVIIPASEAVDGRLFVRLRVSE